MIVIAIEINCIHEQSSISFFFYETKTREMFSIFYCYSLYSSYKPLGLVDILNSHNNSCNAIGICVLLLLTITYIIGKESTKYRDSIINDEDLSCDVQ